MKIAISSYSLRDHINRDIPVWEYPAYARDTYGVDAVEIIQRDIVDGEAGVDRLKEGLKAAGSTLVSLPIDIGDISQADSAKRDEDLRAIERWLDTAATLGCPLARVNSKDGDVGTAIASYQRLVEYGRGIGVTICMENHGGLSAKRDTALAILDGVAGLATSPDFGNFNENERYDFLAAMAPRAKIAHAKTFDFDEDGQMPSFDFARCVKIMDDAGFAGYYSIEFEGNGDQIDGVRRSLALLAEVAASLPRA